jgi:hypothetical protein
MGGHGSGSNPNSKNNLKLWGKGENGNPNALRGLVKLSKAIKHKLGEIDPEDVEKRTYAEVIAEKFVKLARGMGNSPCSVKAVAEILDRTEGKPVQAVDLNMTRTSEEHVAGILESLEALGAQPDRNRVN